MVNQPVALPPKQIPKRTEARDTPPRNHDFLRLVGTDTKNNVEQRATPRRLATSSRDAKDFKVIARVHHSAPAGR
jgi:hypothetical protein